MAKKNSKQLIEGFKVVVKHLTNYKRDLVLLSLMGIFSAIAYGVEPYLVGRIFDTILEPNNIFIGTAIEMPLWLLCIILWIVTLGISNFIDWLITLKSLYLEVISHADYLVRAYNTLLDLPISFHKEENLGEVEDKINNAADGISSISSDVVQDILPQFLTIIIVLAVSFYMNYLLALVLLAGVVAYAVIFIKVVPPLATLQKRAYSTYNRAYGDAYDTMINIRSVKQSVAEKYEKKRIHKGFRLRAASFWNRMNRIWQRMDLYQRLTITLTEVIIFGLGVYMIRRGEMTIGELIMFNGYAVMLFDPFESLGDDWEAIQEGLITLEYSETILQTKKEAYHPKDAVTLSDIKGAIVFKDVSFSYEDDEEVLKDISFSVSPGETVALVGESGVGKSTLIDLIMGYYFASGGEILLDGQKIEKFDLEFLRSKIAVVPQDVVLFNDTIKANIKYGNFDATDEELQRAAEQSHCLEFIEQFSAKWEQVVGERGLMLSAGQKQRVAIARALLKKSSILILDEPTSALDAKSEVVIQQALNQLTRDKTTFIVAHRLSTVRNADKIIVLEDGRVAEIGRHEKLIRMPGGIYRWLYEHQLGMHD